MTTLVAAGHRQLNLLQVDAYVDRLARAKGAGSTAERRQILVELLSEANGEAREFLVRLMVGELRQGALEGLMTEAIASAARVTAGEVRRALMLSGDVAAVAQAAVNEGHKGLQQFRLRLFQPVKPMLAQTVEDVSAALARLKQAGFEYKLDGARVQLHKAGEEVRVFSRRLNDVSAAVPELVEAVKTIASDRIILDGEVLALQPDGSPYPFQVTMRRFGRKQDVDAMRRRLPLTPFFFDCLHLQGEDLIDRPGRERVTRLSEVLPPELRVPRCVTAKVEEAQAFFEQALARGHEGLMAKALDATYEAGNRGSSWLKIKPFHTLDLVVLAAEWGHGRRRGWLSNLHLGARDPGKGGFVMLGKTFKGMTDAMLGWQTARLQALEVARDAYTVFVRPELVVEVAFNDVQAGPQYPGGLVLRFARIKRYRPDKRPEDADTFDTVRAIFTGQAAGTSR